ncbi:MAG: RNA polymerase sigma factor [Planctomycetes bacterium]|nr:RNA polymerase sigma factor [Planctomycetota bacterium]
MECSAKSDEWLMSDVVDGCSESLEPLVRRYANPLLTFIRRMVNHPQQSEELFQDVFLAVWKHRRQYDRGRRFKPWLYGIAINRVRAYLRSRSWTWTETADEAMQDWASSPDPSPIQMAIATEVTSIVEKAVAALPVTQRTVVVLHLWGGLTYGEIAEALGRSAGTVRSNMHHALAALRSCLEPRLR